MRFRSKKIGLAFGGVRFGQADQVAVCVKNHPLKRHTSIKNVKKYNFRIIAKILVTGMVKAMPTDTKIIHLHGLRTARGLRVNRPRVMSA